MFGLEAQFTKYGNYYFEEKAVRCAIESGQEFSRIGEENLLAE